MNIFKSLPRMTAIYLMLLLIVSCSPSNDASGYQGASSDDSKIKNGFDLSNAIIPVDEIRSGGPPRDGIPSIDNPKFISAQEADLNPKERVLGIKIDGIAKAYPINILNWHEIVNDEFGDKPVVITYCPLCGSGYTFFSKVEGRTLTFGVSGLLYNSDVLMYDRQTESLWSQIKEKSVAGELVGTELEGFPTINMTWKEWEKMNPDTRVLSENTGYSKNYDRDPYAGYADRDGTMFPVDHADDRYHAKELVLGLEVDGEYKCYPFSELAKTSGKIVDKFNGEQLTIKYDDENKSARALGSSGEEYQANTLFWFAWIAFHPDSEVFTKD